MITTKEELRLTISEDLSRYELRHPKFLGWFLGDETYSLISFLKNFRKLEYYTNIKKNCFQNILYYYYLFRHRRQRVKLGIYFNINSCGGGIYIPHYAGGIYANCSLMGKNCIISSGCVLGVKGNNPGPILGDNVEVAIGSKIIGNVKIGNNVIVAPNSVVITDIPDNAIVSGVPAKIIKIRS